MSLFLSLILLVPFSILRPLLKLNEKGGFFICLLGYTRYDPYKFSKHCTDLIIFLFTLFSLWIGSRITLWIWFSWNRSID